MGYVFALLIAVPIMLLCVAIISAITRHTKKVAEPALTPRDLEVLQESAEEIVKSIECAAEKAMSQFEEARSNLEQLVARAEKAAEFLEARLGPPSRPSEAVSSADRLDEVMRLSTAGLSKTEIARQLNIGSGEVELLLNLRPQMKALLR